MSMSVIIESGSGKSLHTSEYTIVEKTRIVFCHLTWSDLQRSTSWIGHAWSVNRMVISEIFLRVWVLDILLQASFEEDYA